MAITTTKTVTYEEWLEMPETTDGIEEVVNGEIRLMPPAKRKHSLIVHRLDVAFGRQLDDDMVDIPCGSFGVVISRDPLTCRNPDLAVFIRERMLEKDGYYHSPPELAIEVLSPSNTRADMEEKLRDYEKLGVPEVWIFSPEARTAEVLQLREGKLHRVAIVAEGELRPLHFPTVSIDLARVWPK